MGQFFALKGHICDGNMETKKGKAHGIGFSQVGIQPLTNVFPMWHMKQPAGRPNCISIS